MIHSVVYSREMYQSSVTVIDHEGSYIYHLTDRDLLVAGAMVGTVIEVFVAVALRLYNNKTGHTEFKPKSSVTLLCTHVWVNGWCPKCGARRTERHGEVTNEQSAAVKPQEQMEKQ